MDPVRRRPLVGLAALLAAVSLAGACGSDGGTSDVSTSDVGTSDVGTAEIVDVVDDVAYYGACGNETVVVDGTEWFPLLPEQLADLDESAYPLPTASTPAGVRARVAPPGPGDDVGTMVVYDDGIARFESDSGRVTWLTDEPQTYDWVC